MRRPLSLLAGLTLASLAAVPLASADLVSARCEKEIKDQIANLNIPAERIRKTSLLNIYDGNGEGGGRIDHIEGWVSFNDCKGNLVISISNACLLEQIYTTYECKVPGVKSY